MDKNVSMKLKYMISRRIDGVNLKFQDNCQLPEMLIL